MSINKNDNSQNQVVLDILQQFIKIVKADDVEKRREVAKNAALTLLGIGVLAGINYLTKPKDKFDENLDEEHDEE
jgi:hypothetical protein